jgi:hypothetical protein
MSTSTQRIFDCKKSIAVNYKDVLKIDGTLARLSNAKFAPAARAARAAWAARRPPAARRLNNAAF